MFFSVPGDWFWHEKTEKKSPLNEIFDNFKGVLSNQNK